MTATTTEEAACFLAGTHIATSDSETVVEQLCVGDALRTASGALRPIKWIGRRSYAARFAATNPDVLPIRIAAGALADGVPSRDLFLSPLHALFIDGVLIPAQLLVNHRSITACTDIDPIDYVHIELETHDVILAEAAPAETFVDCNSRFVFQNAGGFSQLYPADIAPRWAFCAPRVTDGFRLEDIRRRIARRAGEGPAPSAPGLLLGRLDIATRERIAGWAWQPDTAGPAELEICSDRGVLARVIANGARPDVLAAGFGPIRCGFELSLTGLLSPFSAHVLQVRRVGDRHELTGSPRRIKPAYTLDSESLDGLADALQIAADADPDGAEADRLAGFLLDQADRLLRRRRLRKADLAVFIDDRLPNPARDAGSHVAVSHMRALRTLGYQVLCVPRDLVADPDALRHLKRWGIGCAARPQYRSVEEALRRHADEVSLVYLHRLANADAFGSLARLLCPQARQLYAVADLHHLRIARQAAIEGRTELMGASRALRAREFAACRQTDAVLTHSTVEAAILRRELPGVQVEVVPWATKADPARGARDTAIAFIGGHEHAPNADAVRWLIRDIMPLVWQDHPDTTCRIVGHGWPADLCASDPRLLLVGPVDDLSAVFDAVRLTVAPLRFGAGVKGKVIDSLVAGLPCVMTQMAAEGLALPSSLLPLLAEGAAAIAERIGALLDDPPACKAIGRAGRAWARMAYGEAEVIRHLQAALHPAPANPHPLPALAATRTHPRSR